MVSLFELLVRFMTKVLRAYFRPFDQFITRVENAGSRVPDLEPRDERIAKIDVARENLEDALVALSELKRDAHQNKVELREALRKLDEARMSHAAETTQLHQIRAIAEADITAFRRMAGINPVRERFVGFLAGIAASLIAAGLWQLGELVFS